MIIQNNRPKLQNLEKARRGETNFFKNMPPLIFIALLLAIVLLTLGLLAPILSPYSIREQSLLNRLKPPIFLTNDVF